MITETAQIPTGRAVLCPKTRVDDVQGLDLADLRREGVFARGPGHLWTWTWTWRWNPAIRSIVHLVALGRDRYPHALALVHPSPASTKLTDYDVKLHWSPCHFGGHRPWFRCPVCDFPRRILYRPWRGSTFACRECGHLTYESRQLHRNRFYEGLTKPLDALEKLQRDLASRSPRRQARALARFELAERAIRGFREGLPE